MKGVTSLIFCVLLFAAACGSQPKPETVTRNGPEGTPSPAANLDQFATTRAVFTRQCEACHGADGSGGTKTVDDKKLKVPTMREGHSLNHTDDEFRKQISEGGDGMPPFKEKLTPDQMNDLVKFVRHEFQHK